MFAQGLVKNKINYKRFPANISGQCLRGYVMNGNAVEADIVFVQ